MTRKGRHPIRIYGDQGVEPHCLPPLIQELRPWPTAVITAHELIHTAWEEQTALLLFPGGADIPFHRALKGRGNQKIRAYVQNGGAFLGICAGAYYGAGRVEFDVGRPLAVVAERELRFFPGIAKGPATGPGSFHYHSEAGARALLISSSFSGETLRSYCNGGGYFLEADRYAHIQVISRYLDAGLAGGSAAIIQAQVGKGTAILSGLHIEIGAAHRSLDPQMSDRLAPYEGARRRLWHHMLAELGLRF